MKFTPKLERAARDYCATIAEACARCKVDPTDAIIDTEDYPVLARQWQVEYSIGWLRGVADLADVGVLHLWQRYAPKSAVRVLTANRRKAA